MAASSIQACVSSLANPRRRRKADRHSFPPGTCGVRRSPEPQKTCNYLDVQEESCAPMIMCVQKRLVEPVCCAHICTFEQELHSSELHICLAKRAS